MVVSSATFVSVVVEILAVPSVGIVPVSLEIASLRILAVHMLFVSELGRVGWGEGHRRRVRPHHHSLEVRPVTFTRQTTKGRENTRK